MKKLLFFLLFLLLPLSAYAEDRYIVENNDGSLTVINYLGGSKDSLDDVMRSFGFAGKPYLKIDSRELPKTDKAFWVLKNGSVSIDELKKSQHQAVKQAEEADRVAVLSKLKITKQEFEKLVSK